MKTGLWMAVILLALLIAGGIWEGAATEKVSQEYQAAGRELLEDVLREEWTAVQRRLDAVQENWRQRLPYLCAVVDHADTELVTAALTDVRAGLLTKEHGRAAAGCLALIDAAEALRLRQAFSMSNVL